MVPTANDSLVFEKESCSGRGYQYATPYVVPLGSGHSESGLRLEEEASKGAIARWVRDAMLRWKVYHFHDTSESAGLKQTRDIGDNSALRADASNLAAFLYMLRTQHPDHYRVIVDTIRMVAPFFEDFVLRPSQLNQEKIRLEWSEFGSDEYFSASSLSDGTIRFICLATLLLQPNLRSTIIVDEPELGLHPYAINVLAGMLQAASRTTTVIVSTQSVPLVNQFEPADLIVVDREGLGGQSTFKRLSATESEHWLDDYGLGDLWEKNLLGGRRQR